MGERTTESGGCNTGIVKRWACVPAGSVFDPRLKPRHRRTLEALGLYTDRHGRCHVKKKTLSLVLGTTEKHVQHYLHELVGLGWLKITPQFRAHGGQRENIYELVLGGGPLTDPPGGSVVGPPHKERVPRTCNNTGPGGPGSEESMNYIDLRETEGASALAPENSRLRPTKPKAPRQPERWNAATVAKYAADLARVHQWGHPSPVPLKVYMGTFRRWCVESGVTYRKIVKALDCFYDQLPPDLEAPAGRVFIKQGFQWITTANEAIYQEELPRKQAANHALWAQVRADLAIWAADNPGATADEQAAMKASLYQHHAHV